MLFLLNTMQFLHSFQWIFSLFVESNRAHIPKEKQFEKPPIQRMSGAVRFHAFI